ncbi:MAG: hypothetical protein AB7L90_20115 [Hyphomicrobiaceae bacterium]
MVKVASFRFCAAVIALGSFAVYFASSFALVARDGTTHFGGDPWLYTELARTDPFTDVGKIAYVIRIHPMTGLLGLAWMKLASPLSFWLTPEEILRCLFAGFGAVGVRAAISAFAIVIPRREALLWGAIYASSLGVWYFSSIEESKALTATLTAIYTAVYLRLRESWTLRRAMLLTFVLAAACLNEIVAIFLVAIPAVDSLVRSGVNVRQCYWIGIHATVGPIALSVMEVASRILLAPSERPEGSDHIGLLIWFIQNNYVSLERLYNFLTRWLLFNVAAPQSKAITWADPSLRYGGDFDNSIANYFQAPVTAWLVVLALAVLITSIVPRIREALSKDTCALLLGLSAYGFIRSVFFLAFNPGECMLYASGTTLAFLLLIAIPFATARIPVKGVLLFSIFVLLQVTNGRFIVG